MFGMMTMRMGISNARNFSDKKMKIIRNILLITLALLVQSTVFGRLDIYGIRPDFAMLVLIFLANISSSVEIILYGFFIGLLQDVYSTELLGYNAFIMSLMGFFLDIAKKRLTVENYSVKVSATLVACLVHDLIYLSMYTKFDLSLIVRLFVLQSFPGAVYTSILALVFISVWEWAISGGVFIVIRELFGLRR